MYGSLCFSAIIGAGLLCDHVNPMGYPNRLVQLRLLQCHGFHRAKYWSSRGLTAFPKYDVVNEVKGMQVRPESQNRDTADAWHIMNVTHFHAGR